MQARLMKMAKRTAGGSAVGPQAARVGAVPHMSIARSLATGVSTSHARGSLKRRAEEPLPRETGKRRAEEEMRRDPGKRPMGSASLDVPRRASVDPVCGPLESWADGEAALGAYHTAVKRILKVDVVEGLFIEEMGYSGMTMSALEDQLKATMKLFIAAQNVAAHREFDRGKRDEHAVTTAELKRTIVEKTKVEEELEQMRGRMEEEEKRNTELVAANEKLRGERRELSRELSVVQKKMEEANQKIDAFTTELRTCYEDAVADFIGSAEYEEKLAAQRVEGYFDLAEKVGEKYPSLDWSFLDGEDEEPEAKQ
ncbi:unnamed protein product, partial [Prunus brigantina]